MGHFKNLIFLYIILTLLFYTFPAFSASSGFIQSGISGEITADLVVGELVPADKTTFLGTSKGLYVFSQSGEVTNYIQTSSAVTNIEVIDDLSVDGFKDVLITTLDIYFPNVQAYDSQNGALLWEFSPKEEIYDIEVLWTMQQMPIFDVSSVQDINGDSYRDVVISSGYSVYMLNGRIGDEIWKFKDSDNVWDISTINDINGDSKEDIVVGDQNGYLYILDGKTGAVLLNKLVSQEYTVINPASKAEVGNVKRSTWDVLPIKISGSQNIVVSAEDGNVYLLDTEGNIIWSQEIIDYVDSLLYSYYGDNPRPTSSSQVNFFNIKIMAVDDVTSDGNKDILVATYLGSSKKSGGEYAGAIDSLTLLDSSTGNAVWKNENVNIDTLYNLETQEVAGIPSLLLPTGKSGSHEKVRVISLKDGSILKTLSINSTASGGGGRSSFYYTKKFDNRRFLLTSSRGDVIVSDLNGEITWTYPRISSVSVKKIPSGGLLIKSRDNAEQDNFLDEGSSRKLFVVSDESNDVVWSYEMPNDLYLETGGLQGVKIIDDINGDSVSDILAYRQKASRDSQNTQDLDARVIIMSGSNGKVLFEQAPIIETYAGAWNEIFSADNLTEYVWEKVLDGRGYTQADLADVGEEESIDIKREVSEKLNEIENNQGNLKIRKYITSVDMTSDLSGDGVPDLLVGMMDDIVILNSLYGNIIWSTTRECWKYNSPFGGNNNCKQPSWFRNDRSNIFSIDDVNSDGFNDMVLVDWDGIFLLFSNNTDSGLTFYNHTSITSTSGIDPENVRKVGDIDGDGFSDIMFSRYVEDAPSRYMVISAKTGSTLLDIVREGTTMDLAIDDFDGDGYKDTLLFKKWTESGPQFQIISGRTQNDIWNYVDYKETWSLESAGYSELMPATPIQDMNGDGITDLALVRTLPWTAGAELLIYDVKGNNILKTITLENVDESENERRWQPGVVIKEISDLNGDGVNEVATIALFGERNRKQMKLVIVDVNNGAIVSDFNAEGTKIVQLSNNLLGVIGNSGEIYILDAENDLEILTPSKNSVIESPVKIEWARSSKLSNNIVMIDGKRVAKTTQLNAEVEIEAGNHSIMIYSVDTLGKGIYNSVDVFVDKSSTRVVPAIILIIILICALFFPKILEFLEKRSVLKHG